jgi:hypothetical protein
VLAAFCWTKSLLCNVAVFIGMLLYPESTLQLCSSRRFCDVFKEVYFSSLSAVRTTWYSVRTLIGQQHLSRRRGIPSGRLFVKASSVWTTRTFRSRLHPSGHNDKSSGPSSEFEKNPALKCIRLDAIQCLTSIRVSASRHSYEKTAATVRMMCDPVWTSAFKVRTLKALLW